MSLSSENLKEKGYKLNVTTSKYSVEYNGEIIAYGYPNLLFKNRKGSRYNLHRNLELARSDAESYFWKLNVIKVYKKYEESGIILNWEKWNEENKRINELIDVRRNFELAIDHVDKNGNLVLFGNNLILIMNLYEALKKDDIIIYDEEEKLWKINMGRPKFMEEINLNEQ